MSDDWPSEGRLAAAEFAEAWRDEFIKHKRNGEDHAWAAKFADRARDRFMARVKAEAGKERRPHVRE